MSDVSAIGLQAHEAPRASLCAHDHAVCIYERHEDMARPLAHFLADGIGRREQSVFVHSFPSDEEAWAFVAGVAPDAQRHRGGIVLVSLYREAFQGAHPRIDYAHVVDVIERLLGSAKEKGLQGTRIFVDASRVYFEEERSEEWFAFESWLGRRLQSAVGLVCAYRKRDALRPDLFPEMLRTHAYRFDAPT